MADVNEKHFSAAELAALWNVSADTIRRLFFEEPGVLDLGRPTRRKRVYRPIRIPASVAERVYRRLTTIDSKARFGSRALEQGGRHGK